MTTQDRVSRSLRPLAAANGDHTVTAIARRLGLSVAGLRKKLSGERRWSVDDLDLIASTYAVDVRVLLSTAWRAADLPEETNKVTYSTLSFRHIGRRGRAVPGGAGPYAVAA